MQTISSKDNSKLKLARKMVAGTEREHVFLEGLRLVEEALKSDIEKLDILMTPRAAEGERGARIVATNSDIVNLVDESLFDQISDTKQSQGIALIAKRPVTDIATFEQRLGETRLIVALHSITNPSNLGAVLRTAEAAGVSGVIVSRESTDVFAVKALRSAMGSTLRIPIWTGATLDEIAAWGRSRGMLLTGTDAHAGTPHTMLEWKKPRILVFGSEAHGLSETEKSHLDDFVSIPMDNGVESLNLAVSAGILMFEAKR
jgi:TrmH family RNA methyltransferase